MAAVRASVSTLLKTPVASAAAAAAAAAPASSAAAVAAAAAAAGAAAGAGVGATTLPGGSGVLAAAAAAAAGKQADSVVRVNCTMNNIHVCVANLDGAVVSKVSGGLLGFSHRERAGPAAAFKIGEAVAKRAVERGHRVAHVEMKGPSRGRAQVLRGIAVAGLRVVDIRDVTPMPTNGCRPPHARRLFSTLAAAPLA